MSIQLSNFWDWDPHFPSYIIMAASSRGISNFCTFFLLTSPTDIPLVAMYSPSNDQGDRVLGLARLLSKAGRSVLVISTNPLNTLPSATANPGTALAMPDPQNHRKRRASESEEATDAAHSTATTASAAVGSTYCFFIQVNQLLKKNFVQFTCHIGYMSLLLLILFTDMPDKSLPETQCGVSGLFVERDASHPRRCP